MSRADSITAYRVDSRLTRPKVGEHLIEHYRTISVGRLLSKGERDSLYSFATDPSAHDERPKACLFAPGVGLEVFNDSDTARALICFGCSQWQMKSADWTYFGNFDKARPKILLLTKQLFPKDTEIGKLK